MVSHTTIRPLLGLGLLALMGVGTLTLQATPTPDEPPGQAASPPVAVPGGTGTDLESLAKRLGEARVIVVGETHNRLDHHQNQLSLIQHLQAQGKPLAVGLEMVHQPFQSTLDAYVAGDHDEAELLEGIEYFTRWGYDYRLYRPIFRFAREQDLPLVALNLPHEITRTVAANGMEGLTPEQKAQIPEMVLEEPKAYGERLKEVFDRHPGDRSFESFLQVQRLWDAGMAAAAAEFLKANPETTLVILAGSGHVAAPASIPERLAARGPWTIRTINQQDRLDAGGPPVDWIVLTDRQDLPPAGRLGAYLESTEAGVTIRRFGEESAAKAAGLQVGDRLIRVADRSISGYANVKLALLDRQVGDTVPVTVMRDPEAADPRERRMNVTLR